MTARPDPADIDHILLADAELAGTQSKVRSFLYSYAADDRYRETLAALDDLICRSAEVVALRAERDEARRDADGYQERWHRAGNGWGRALVARRRERTARDAAPKLSDTWEAFYTQEHRTRHAMEDTIAALRVELAEAREETQTSLDIHGVNISTMSEMLDRERVAREAEAGRRLALQDDIESLRAELAERPTLEEAVKNVEFWRDKFNDEVVAREAAERERDDTLRSYQGLRDHFGGRIEELERERDGLRDESLRYGGQIFKHRLVAAEEREKQLREAAALALRWLEAEGLRDSIIAVRLRAAIGSAAAADTETCPCGKGCSYEPYDCGAYTMRRYVCEPAAADTTEDTA